MAQQQQKQQKLKSDAILELMKTHLSTDVGKELVKKIGLVYQINISPKKIGFNEETYVVDLKKGEVKKGVILYEEDGKPDATFSFTDDNFVKIAMGKMNPQIAFMRFHFHFHFLNSIIKYSNNWLIDIAFCVTVYKGAMKVKGSLRAAQKFTLDLFPKPSKM